MQVMVQPLALELQRLFEGNLRILLNDTDYYNHLKRIVTSTTLSLPHYTRHTSPPPPLSSLQRRHIRSPARARCCRQPRCIRRGQRCPAGRRRLPVMCRCCTNHRCALCMLRPCETFCPATVSDVRLLRATLSSTMSGCGALKAGRAAATCAPFHAMTAARLPLSPAQQHPTPRVCRSCSSTARVGLLQPSVAISYSVL
jgi:hypothetical protein